VTISLILLGSWVFKYPQIIKAPIKVTTENPPSNVIARTDGRIVSLFVEDNDRVKTDDVLALLENTARYRDVQALKMNMDSFRFILPILDQDTIYHFPSNLVLGAIQSPYASFLKNYDDLRNFIQLDYHDQKVATLKEEIQKYRSYSWTLKKQSRIINDEMKLMQNQFKRDSLLFFQGVIPEAEYEKSKSALLQKQRAYEESRSNLVNTEIQISRLEQEILDLQLQKNDQLGKLRLSVIESFDNLTAAIVDWEHRFVLRSSVSGVVSFTQIRSANQNVRKGDLVMTIIPQNSGDIIGKIELPILGSGKVEKGQAVNIRFDNYPHMEYGIVKGKVRSISLVTSNNAYSVIVNFPEGLATTYDVPIVFTQDMQGTAEIITADERFLERIVNPVKAVIERQKEL